MAYKVFSNGDALTGSELNTYLMNQSVMVFASATARDAALPSPTEGMLVWLQDVDKYTYRNGSAWTDLAVPFNSNAVINGAFDIWQRGTSLTAATTTRYLADRWETFGITSTVAPSQQAFTPGTAPVTGYEGSFFHRTVVASASLAGSGAVLDTKIEDVRTYAGQTVTVSFWAKADASKNMSIELLQNFGTGGSATVNITPSKKAITSSWARYSYSVAVPSITGKTIGTGSYLALYLWYDAGSDFNTRTGSLGNQSGTFDIWGVQVESGSTATAFKRNASNIGEELASCQRYYFRESLAGFAGSAIQGFALSSTSYTMWTRFPVTMRTAPTSLDYSNLRVLDSGNSAQSVTNLTILSTDAVKTSSSDVTVTVSGATSGRTGYLQANAGAAYVGFSAEL